MDFYSFFRYHVAYLRLILSESESCVTGAEMTKKEQQQSYAAVLLSVADRIIIFAFYRIIGRAL